MRYVVVSYPAAVQSASAWIDGVRQRYGGLKHSVLPPHFTFVFPLYDIEQDSLVQHLSSITHDCLPIPFALRSSILVNDDSSPNVYVMLVPDEGFSGIVKLHDRLYTGFLADRLRLDIPFIPHVTVGYSTDIHVCKSAVDDLNSQDFEIKGAIDRLDLVRIEGEAFETICPFPLGTTASSDS